jgi:valyl-tRNA synthetase
VGQWWIDNGVFSASAKNTGRTFSIVIPPPNVTGVLHMGHMLNHTEHDVVVRWRRMLGFNTLWLPAPITPVSPHRWLSSGSSRRKARRGSI